MSRDDDRKKEIDKYRHCYTQSEYDYQMGGQRYEDACEDIVWSRTQGCNTLLDIGCGRGEMIRFAETMGFDRARGTETVDELCDGAKIVNARVDDLHNFHVAEFDLVTSFDVIEHLLRGDDELLLVEMSRIADRALVVTANNRNSVDPTTGMDLHINKREYEVWDRMIRDLWEPDFIVSRRDDVRYVSATWRAIRK